MQIQGSTVFQRSPALNILLDIFKKILKVRNIPWSYGTIAVLFSSFKSILFSYIQLQNWTGILDPTIAEHRITSKQEKGTDISMCTVS